jgi:hypothetical protein
LGVDDLSLPQRRGMCNTRRLVNNDLVTVPRLDRCDEP